MANAKLIEKMVVDRGSKFTKKEETVEKPKRVRLHEKPWEGLEPGTNDWKTCWRENPTRQSQDEMLEYQKVWIVKRQAKLNDGKKRKRLLSDVEIIKEAKRVKEEEDAKLLAAFIKKHGTQKRRSGGGQLWVDDDDDNDIEADDDDSEYDDDDDEEEIVSKIKATKKDRKLVKELKKMPKKEVERFIKETKKTQKKEVMRTVNKAFGADGRTFDLYAVSIPDNVKSISQLKNWLMSEKRTIVEFKDGELRAYTPERVTSSGRVAKVTVKKQGGRQIVTYRSNKNSKITQ
jgi:hypothetical protein